MAKFIDTISALLVLTSLLLVIHFKLTIQIYAWLNGGLTLLALLTAMLLFWHIWQHQLVNDTPISKEEKAIVTFRSITTSSIFFFINSIGGLL